MNFGENAIALYIKVKAKISLWKVKYFKKSMKK